MKQKQKLIHLKAIDSEKKTISAYVSTFDWDRTDERFSQGAWDFKNYLSNPVVLWAHKKDIPPIAKSLTIAEDSKGLISEMQFDTQDEFAMKIFSLYERGFMNTFSVGFAPRKFVVEQIAGTDFKGLVWTDAELMEYSAVPVPANPQALIQREDAEMISKLIGENYVSKSDHSDGYYFRNFSQADKDDFERSLKSLIDMAKVARNQKMDDQKIALVKTSMAVLQEIVLSNSQFATVKEFRELSELVQQLAGILKQQQESYNIDPQDLVAKFMQQFNAALKGCLSD